jgi:hypothetical protein
MSRPVAVVLYTLIAVCTQAHAEFRTGNDIKAGLEAWERQNYSFEATYAAGYVIGAFDTSSSVNVCAPANITVGQVTALVLKYMQEHPEILHFSGDIVVNRALSNAWPCKRPSSSPAPKATPRPANKAQREVSPF